MSEVGILAESIVKMEQEEDADLSLTLSNMKQETVEFELLEVQEFSVEDTVTSDFGDSSWRMQNGSVSVVDVPFEIQMSQESKTSEDSIEKDANEMPNSSHSEPLTSKNLLCASERVAHSLKQKTAQRLQPCSSCSSLSTRHSGVECHECTRGPKLSTSNVCSHVKQRRGPRINPSQSVLLVEFMEQYPDLANSRLDVPHVEYKILWNALVKLINNAEGARGTKSEKAIRKYWSDLKVRVRKLEAVSTQNRVTGRIRSFPALSELEQRVAKVLRKCTIKNAEGDERDSLVKVLESSAPPCVEAVIVEESMEEADIINTTALCSSVSPPLPSPTSTASPTSVISPITCVFTSVLPDITTTTPSSTTASSPSFASTAATTTTALPSLCTSPLPPLTTTSTDTILTLSALSTIVTTSTLPSIVATSPALSCVTVTSTATTSTTQSSAPVSSVPTSTTPMHSKHYKHPFRTRQRREYLAECGVLN